MKLCPNCKNTYTDDSLLFCLADGSSLAEVRDSNAPTLVISDAGNPAKPPRTYSTHFSLILITVLVFSLCGISASVLGVIGYLNRTDANSKNTNLSNRRQPSNGRSVITDPSPKLSAMRTISASEHLVGAMSLSPDGKRLAIASADNALSIWGVDTGERKQTLENGSKLYDLSFTSDGNLRGLTSDGTIRLWDLQTSGSRILFSAKRAVQSFSLWPNGGLFACDCGKNEVKVFDINTGELKFSGARGDFIWDIALSRDGKLVAAGGGRKGKPVMIWDVESGQLKQQIAEKRAIGGMAFSADGKYFAMGGNDDGIINLSSTNTWKVVKTLPRQGTQVSNIKFTEDGRYLVAFINLAGYVFDLSSNTVEKLDRYTTAVSISEDGKTRAIASTKKTVTIWR